MVGTAFAGPAIDPNRGRTFRRVTWTEEQNWRNSKEEGRSFAQTQEDFHRSDGPRAGRLGDVSGADFRLASWKPLEEQAWGCSGHGLANELPKTPRNTHFHWETNQLGENLETFPTSVIPKVDGGNRKPQQFWGVTHHL